MSKGSISTNRQLGSSKPILRNCQRTLSGGFLLEILLLRLLLLLLLLLLLIYASVVLEGVAILTTRTCSLLTFPKRRHVSLCSFFLSRQSRLNRSHGLNTAKTSSPFVVVVENPKRSICCDWLSHL